jgi:hypothetical protein
MAHQPKHYLHAVILSVDLVDPQDPLQTNLQNLIALRNLPTRPDPISKDRIRASKGNLVLFTS